MRVRDKESMAMLGMIATAFGEIVGSLTMGRLVDSLDPKKCIFFNLISIILMTGSTIYSIYV